MTREQIEKAAMGYAVGNSWYPGETSYESDIKEMEESFADAFKAGAQWRINAVWHDRTEKADTSKELIIMYPNGLARIILLNPNLTFDGFLLVDMFIKWAYVSDILPERKEETNGGR